MNEDAQHDLSQEQVQNLAGETMESLGVPGEASQVLAEEPQEDLPPAVKKRLGMQEKRHKKELRAMQERMNEMQNHFSNPNTFPGGQDNMTNPYVEQGAGQNPEDMLTRAVMHGMHLKERQDKEAKDREAMAHVQKSYAHLDDHLDNASQKYDDFDDIVRNPEAPFSQAMRDASLLLPNAADVLYKLGKNPDELRRINNLHPLDVAKEMVKLSIALNAAPNAQVHAPKQLGQIKSSPVGTSNVTDKTSVSELRRRLKSNWK